MILRHLLPLLLALLPLMAPAQGLPQALPQVLPQPISDTVSDFADLLPPEEEARISALLAAGRQETGVHVTLVTMERIADHGGADERIEDYAKRLFNVWGVGDAARDDGILILIARETREMRIALGSGYEVIWDNAAQRVIDRNFLPAFAEGDYIGGITAGVPATFDLIAAPFASGQSTPPDPLLNWEDIATLGLFAAFAVWILGLALRRPVGDLAVRFRPCPRCGKKQMARRRQVQTPASATKEGLGLAVTLCAACGYQDSQPYVIARPSDDSSSGGGFGGGSSSGGGATGRW